MRKLMIILAMMLVASGVNAQRYEERTLLDLSDFYKYGFISENEYKKIEEGVNWLFNANDYELAVAMTLFEYNQTSYSTLQDDYDKFYKFILKQEERIRLECKNGMHVVGQKIIYTNYQDTTFYGFDIELFRSFKKYLAFFQRREAFEIDANNGTDDYYERKKIFMEINKPSGRMYTFINYLIPITIAKKRFQITNENLCFLCMCRIKYSEKFKINIKLSKDLETAMKMFAKAKGADMIVVRDNVSIDNWNLNTTQENSEGKRRKRSEKNELRIDDVYGF